MARQKPHTTRKTRNIWVQPRDLEILLSIGTARMLTIQHVEWLHFASWRKRYGEATDLRKTDAKAPAYRPARQVHERLAGMEQHGLLARATRTTDRGSSYFRRLPDVFSLTAAGADLLCAQFGVELEELSVVARRIRALQNLEHTIAIGQFYAALRAERQHRNLDLGGWMGDHRLHYNYDRVFAIGGDGKTSVIPDATCVIDGQRYFVEIDRGTRPLKTWATKIYAYEAYRNSGQLRARYGVDTFKLLVVAPNKTRLYRIATEVATVTRCATQDYLFAQESMIHPMLIRKGWYILSNVTMHKKQIVNTTVSTADIQLKRCALWENLADD